MKDLAKIELDAERFAELQKICSRDPAFPDSWDAWMALVGTFKEQSISGGEDHVLEINPETFREWCAHVGFVPGLDALRAYAQVSDGRGHGAAPPEIRWNGPA